MTRLFGIALWNVLAISLGAFLAFRFMNPPVGQCAPFFVEETVNVEMCEAEVSP